MMMTVNSVIFARCGCKIVRAPRNPDIIAARAVRRLTVGLPELSPNQPSKRSRPKKIRKRY